MAASAAPALRHRLTPRRPVVFLYHGFCEERRTDDPENLFVPLEEVDRQLRWLADHGWRGLTLEEYAACFRRRSGERTFLLTIDDAFDSVELVVPLLEAYHVPATLFVPSGLMGQTATWLPEPADEPILTAQQIRALPDLLGVEVHSHGHVSMQRLDAGTLHREVVEARELLVEHVGVRPTAFAYPFGDHDADTREAVRRAGYRLAFSVFDDVDDFAISRVDVNSTDTLSSFRLKLAPGYRAAWRALSRATIVRRVVRGVLTVGRGRS